MSLVHLLLDNYVMVAELLGLWVMLGSNVHLSRRTINATRIVMILIFMEAVCWSVERWTRELDHLTAARVILTPTIYLLHPLIMVGIIDMAEFVKKHKLLFYLPILLSVPVLYTSQWTHLIYWFEPSNLYHGADSILCYYPYLLFLLYVVLFMVFFTARYAMVGAAERRGILISIFAAMIGVALHVILGVDEDYSTLFAAVLVIYYLSLYVLTAKEDTLTHLLNRQCYYADMEERGSQITGVVSVDMNDLKKLNDVQGHDAGDRALKTVADCLMKTRIRGKKVYRIGGDEFAIFYFGNGETDIKNDIEAMRAELAQTEYVCAFGYEMTKGRSIREVMRLADEQMYANKAKLKNMNEMRLVANREAIIHLMHEALGSGMWGMDFDEEGKMTTVKWSPEFRKMIGYTDEKDFPNTLEAWSDRLHPDDREKVLQEYNDTIEDYSGQKTYDVEYRLQTKNGEWRWFHALGRLLRRENGVPLSYIGMFVDITDKKVQA